MATLSILLALLGFYFFYLTSEKSTRGNALKIEHWIQRNPTPARCIGVMLMATALSVSIDAFGVGAGILTFSIVLMMLGSLVIVLAPLNMPGYRVISIVFACSFILEIILF